MQITSALMACPQELRLLETPETEEQQVHCGDVLKGHPIHGKFTIFWWATKGPSISDKKKTRVLHTTKPLSYVFCRVSLGFLI